MLGTVEVSHFMPLGSDGRRGERVIRLPDRTFRSFVSELGVESTGELEDTSINVGSLWVSNLGRIEPSESCTYVLGREDTDERSDELWSETLEHVWRHCCGKHSSSSELFFSSVSKNRGSVSLQVQ